MIVLAQLTTTSNPFAWYLTRDLAIAAYFTLTLSVLFGLAISLSRATGQRIMWHINDLHYTLATLTGVLIAGHMLTLLFDTYLPFSISNLLLPLNQPTSTVTVDLGVLAFYGMITLLLSSWFKKHLKYTVWRAIHYVSFVTFILVTIHGWFTGTDSATLWMRSMYFGCVLAVGTLLAARILISSRGHKDTSSSTVRVSRALPVSLIAAFLIGILGICAMRIIL